MNHKTRRTKSTNRIIRNSTSQSLQTIIGKKRSLKGNEVIKN